MKQYTDEEILTYARSHVHRVDRQKGHRLLLTFMAIGSVVLIVSLISAYFDRCKKTGRIYSKT